MNGLFNNKLLDKSINTYHTRCDKDKIQEAQTGKSPWLNNTSITIYTIFYD